MSMSSDQAHLLRIYLQDHAAGAVAGSRRAERLADAERDSEFGARLAALATDIEHDRQTLMAFMESVDVAPSRVKSAAASLGERLGTLKLNGRLTARSPLSTLVELEALQMAVRGKLSLWETLQVAIPRVTVIDLDELIERASLQLETLSQIHSARAPSTFATPQDAPQHPGGADARTVTPSRAVASKSTPMRQADIANGENPDEGSPANRRSAESSPPGRTKPGTRKRGGGVQP